MAVATATPVRFTLPLIASLILVAGSARAETAPPWDSGCASGEPVLAVSVPANIGAIPFLASPGVITASLLAPDGTEVATNLVSDGEGDALLNITGELEAGKTYTLRWSDSCDGLRTRTFNVTPAIAMPSSAGDATLGALDFENFASCTSAGKPIGDARRAIHLAPSEELAPLLSMANVDLIIDGNPWSAGANRWGGSTSGLVGRVSRSCPAASITHSAAVRVRLPNGTVLETKPLSVELVCPDFPPPGRSCDERATPGPAEPDPEARAPITPDEEPRAGAYGGCTAGTGATTGMELVLVGLAMAWGVRRRVR